MKTKDRPTPYRLLPAPSAAPDLSQRSDVLARILDLADDAIISIDRRQVIVLFNQGAERMFGYTADEMLGEPLDVLLPASFGKLHRAHIETFDHSTVAARRMGERGQILGRRKDGNEFPAEASISKVTVDNETMFTVIMRDVTERSRADERLKASLRDKEVLLKEVHHRVKNNLQVISSMLGLQARSISDGLIRKKFEESQYRIQSMALLHEGLCESGDLGRIDFASYLGSLAERLFRFYETGSRICLHQDLERLDLGMDAAVPCGLIVSELLSNALKYAFPDERFGDVWIELRRQPPGRARLVVADSGGGMPGGFNWLTSRSLGLRLVRTLAEQLGGTIETDQKVGVRFTLTFPYEEPIPRREEN